MPTTKSGWNRANHGGNVVGQVGSLESPQPGNAAVSTTAAPVASRAALMAGLSVCITESPTRSTRRGERAEGTRPPRRVMGTWRPSPPLPATGTSDPVALPGPAAAWATGAGTDTRATRAVAANAVGASAARATPGQAAK